MCGIAGYFGSESLDPARIRACLNRMNRRGPDHREARNWISPSGHHCYLLHSRLSIIDLDERSNQPFRVGSKWIVFNGELYNYREIRHELISSGYTKFATQSDTEVLLAALDQFGNGILDRCEGMWSFAMYDEVSGTLTLCRDRFGEKPLYVYRDGSGIYFASEVKFLTCLLGQQLEINQQQLYRYLVNGYKSLYKSHGETFFKGLKEVPAATVLQIDSHLAETQRAYWRPAIQIDDRMSYDDAVSGIRQRLIRSVELRLRADVPIAFCMSGGVDSNSLISIAKRVFDYDVHGFTIVNTDERYEEQETVEQSVRELGIRHTNIPVETRDFLPKLRELVRQHDAPVYTITYFAHWLLMESVHQHGYRISVSGTSADELFTGYFDHHLLYLAEIRDDAQLFAQAARGWEERVKPIVRNPLLNRPDLFILQPEFREHMYLGADLFASYLRHPWHEAFIEQKYSDHLLRNRMLNELFHEATPVILHEDDLNAMYFSIENRSPFLDRDLFEYCNSIPTRYLIRDGFAKVLLRDAMRGIVPNCVLDNPRKVGFNAPIFSFLDMKDPEVRANLLDSSPIFEHIRRDKIEQIIAKPGLPNSESKFLFYFLTSKMFLEEFQSRQVNLRAA